MRTAYKVLVLLIASGFPLFSSAQTAGDGEGNFNAFPDHLVIKAKGGPAYVTITAENDVSLIPTDSWVDARYLKGDSVRNIRITAKRNTANTDRKASVVVKTKRGDSARISILQPKPFSSTGIYIRAASYNIRVAVAADKETGNGWHVRKKPLAEQIKNANIDILGTQEGNYDQMNDLMALLPQYAYIGFPYAGADGKAHTASIVYKRAMFDVMDKGVFWYSPTPDIKSIGWDATDLRICTWAKIRHKSSGVSFYFFTSHFYWRYKTARLHSGKVMIKQIKKITQGDALPVISTGDLNSSPLTPQVDYILTYLKDAYKVAQTPPAGPIKTGFHGGVFKGQPAFRIDYLFVNEMVRVLGYSVLSTPYKEGRHPSDHFPVVCDLFLKR